MKRGFHGKRAALGFSFQMDKSFEMRINGDGCL
jgi:16S rRNA C1402 N4-methylase RsmH